MTTSTQNPYTPKSHVMGVRWDKNCQKWEVVIRGKRIGRFKELGPAIQRKKDFLSGKYNPSTDKQKIKPAEKQSGYKGINWDKSSECWELKVKGKLLARYKTVDAALTAKAQYLDGKFVKPERANASKKQSGHKGISWDKARGRWEVRIASVYVGRFDDLGRAVLAKKIYLGKESY